MTGVDGTCKINWLKTGIRIKFTPYSGKGVETRKLRSRIFHPLSGSIKSCLFPRYDSVIGWCFVLDDTLSSKVNVSIDILVLKDPSIFSC